MKIRAIIFTVLLLATLSGCVAAPESAPTTIAPTQTATPGIAPTAAPTAGTEATIRPIIQPEDYPRVDGSTACLPLMALVRSRTTGEDLLTAQTYTDCSTTPVAYISLVDGQADLLLVYEPADSTREYINSSGAQLDFTPVGRDALVFLANEINPVTSLTEEQLISIYTGETTNWQSVGGVDAEIIAYQREQSSGSQALFIKLLMKDTPPMQAPTELYPSEMGELINAIASYSGEGNALGYSVYYYARNMYAMPGNKFIGVNGIMPSDESIADGSYPFVNEFYVVTRSGETDPATIALRDWITGENGRQAVVDAGYVPAE